MADPFVAEIRMFSFNFAPKGWAFCDGQLLPLSQNTALFSLLGTTYGGNGKSNFALPDLQGRAAMHPGQGPGLSLHDLGEMGGSEHVTLLETEIPAHTHLVKLRRGLRAADAAAANSTLPDNRVPARAAVRETPYVDAADPDTVADVNMAKGALSASLMAQGGGQPHNNMQPYLTLNFCIALQGVYPPRG